MIGFHCSHEAYSPAALLALATLAEQAGFGGVMCSDHFHPWLQEEGHSGFAWAWLGAALARTHLSCGVVNCPLFRYHPVVIAQAVMTLCELFPGRFWLAVGTGEYLNESLMGEAWPQKSERRAKLEEAISIMRALWQGETVTMKGAFYTVFNAKLYAKGVTPPLLLGAALTADTAQWAGSWADGLITTVHPVEEQKKLISAFYKGGGEHKPLYLQALHAYAPTQEQAEQEAWQRWRHVALETEELADLKSPQAFAKATRKVRPEALSPHIRMSGDLAQHQAWLEEYRSLGFSHIYLYNAAADQRSMIEDFGKEILPHFKKGEQSSCWNG